MKVQKIKLFKVTTGFTYKEGYDSNINIVTVLANDGEEAIKKVKNILKLTKNETIESVTLVSKINIW